MAKEFLLNGLSDNEKNTYRYSKSIFYRPLIFKILEFCLLILLFFLRTIADKHNSWIGKFPAAKKGNNFMLHYYTMFK